MLHAPMLDLGATYSRLARPWSHEQLAAHYREANRRGAQAIEDVQEVPDRPISLLATGIPASASFSVAIHVLHALPTRARGQLANQLVDTAGKNAADVLHRCHLALELDGRAHDYAADEWLPVIYDVAAPLLESARLDGEPPSVVQHAQEAVHWLASVVINLDHNSAETPAALADAVGRLLIVCVFTDAARSRGSGRRIAFILGFAEAQITTTARPGGGEEHDARFAMMSAPNVRWGAYLSLRTHVRLDRRSS